METVKSITLISSLPFTLIFVILLCTASFAIARPFLALGRHPRQLRDGRLSLDAGEWNTLAAALMTLLLALILIGPLALIASL